MKVPDGFHLVNGRLPWGQLPPLVDSPAYPHMIYQAFRGWDQGLWHDGPTVVIVDGRVRRYVLPGVPVPLSLDDLPKPQEGLDTWLAAREGLAWKKSLALAFREGLSLPDAAYVLEGLGSDPAHALVLLGLRLGWPNTQLFALDFPDELKPQWKRFAQNLNLSTWAAPAQLKACEILRVDQLSAAWPQAAAQRFWAQLSIPVLPGKLAQRFTHP